jgi:hypothetical protein
MPRAIFPLGLCGSGKSWLAEELKQQIGAEVFEGVHGEQGWPEVRRALLGGRDIIIEEIYCCDATYRDRICRMYLENIPGLITEWLCFENDLDSANWNVDRRLGKDAPAHRRINGRLATIYSIPAGAQIMKITRIGRDGPSQPGGVDR